MHAPAPRRTRAVAFLVGSLLLGVLAVGLVVTAMRRTERRALESAAGIVGGAGGDGSPLPEGVVELVVAVRDLYVGVPVTDADVGVRRFAAIVAPKTGTFRAVKDVVGRTPRERILADEVLRGERLANAEAGVGLNAVLAPGRRGITIATDTETGLAGLVQPGNHVDVIVTIPPDDPSAVGARWVTETILQNVKVLAVGASLDAEQAVAATAGTPATDAKSGAPSTGSAPRTRSSAPRQKPSLTLEVDPVQAEKLSMALKRGEIRVALRSDLDREQTYQEGMVTASRILGLSDGVSATVTPEEPPAPRRKRRRRANAAVAPSAAAGVPNLHRAEVIQGSQRSSVTFQPDGTAVETRIPATAGDP
jgi:pilus assembly protein CpaB